LGRMGPVGTIGTPLRAGNWRLVAISHLAGCLLPPTPLLNARPTVAWGILYKLQ
jgi:hypothetical protein